MQAAFLKYALLLFMIWPLAGSAQVIPVIKIGYGHYGSFDQLKWRYSNIARVNFDRSIEIHHYYFPADFKLLITPNIRIGTRYAYGLLRATEKNTRFLPEMNSIHSIDIHCDLILNPHNALKIHLSPGGGKLLLRSHELNPFYVGFETPHRIHTFWSGNYFRFDTGFIYQLGESKLSLEGLAGLRFGLLSLDKMRFASREVAIHDYNSEIRMTGGYFEFGLSYAFYHTGE